MPYKAHSWNEFTNLIKWNKVHFKLTLSSSAVFYRQIKRKVKISKSHLTYNIK